MKKLEGKVAIITGGNAGLGKGIAIAFAQEGAEICICARRQDKLDEAATEIQKLTGSKVLTVQCDLTKRDELENLVKATAAHFGGIDILVNNGCSIPLPLPMEETSEDIYKLPMQSGLDATYTLMQLCFPFLKERGGKVINFSSAAGSRGSVGATAYAAAKAGIEGLTRAAALEWGPHQINVNCVSPFGRSEIVETALTAMGAESGANPLDVLGFSSPAVGYLGDPLKHIAPPVVFLASADSDYITGHVLPVDGGQLELGI